MSRTTISAFVYVVFSGAGHGGRGGGNTANPTTGSPYGQVFEPVDRGCNGGSSSASGSSGRGAGVIYLKVTETLQNDGEISCNGESATGAGGGGSGGSILIDVNNVKVLVNEHVKLSLKRYISEFMF